MARSLLVPFLAALTLATLAPRADADFLPLPASGAQVNDDQTNSIDPAQDAGVSDVSGGTVTAGKVQVPWATFEQKTGASQQIFVRAFKSGAWVTQGFPASLNIDPTKEAEAPSIDFAGTGRTVPWASWYEPNDAFGTPTNVFASRFNATANLWLPSGQDRTGGSLVPSLNIHTDRTAENPSVAGGATVAGNDPVPWVAWEENNGAATDAAARRQIYVAKGVKQAAAGTPCTGFKPAGGNNMNGFCWQQVGIDRLDATTGTSSSSGDPTLNIDPTRAGVEPDIAFTGASDTVPWVVWYEKGTGALGFLRTNEQVFAAKAVSSASADGGFEWHAVGNGTAGHTNVIDTSGSTGFGPCTTAASAEDTCSLNKVATNDAENPRVAAGTLTPGNPTVPWVVWQEVIAGGINGVFVSRLVGGDHFELFNSGQPISNTLNDATRPDITFSGNTPYISWLENVSGRQLTFVGHFEGGVTAPVFRLDTPTGITNGSFGNVPDLRAPISSGCTANPTNADGQTCQGGAAGTPFFLFTAGAPGAQKLFAEAFAPSDVMTLPASNVTTASATLIGAANPGGARTLTRFDFGPTAGYGSKTADAPIGPATTETPFNATAAGLANGTMVHFRAVARSDFEEVDGADQTLSVVNATPVVTFTPLKEKLKLKKLGRGRMLPVIVTVSEPSTVTVSLANKRGKVVRQATADAVAAGDVIVVLNLKHVKAGKYTLVITATDAKGVTSDPVGQKLKLVG